MLDRLYKKLNFIFIFSIMLIITLILGILCTDRIRTERDSDSSFFQRMAVMMVYQLESDTLNMKNAIKAFEDKHAIFSCVQDQDGTLLYKGELDFPTDPDFLLEQLWQQIGSQYAQYTLSSKRQISTTQSGVFEISGTSDDKYWGITACIVSQNKNLYYLTLIQKQQSALEILQKQLPSYLMLWIFSLAGVILISRFLLKKAFQPTEQVLKSQKEFIASASHELKSPLAVILANAEQLEKTGTSDEKIKKAAEKIDTECMRMSKLIKDMLLLASSDAKTWTLHKSIVDVDTLLITLYETYEPVCIQNNITLNLDLPEDTCPKLYTDKERLLQILCIYMDNALHHARDNTRIEIRTAHTQKELIFYIADHGQGIPPEDKPYIFNRFYCADKSRSDKSNFGLGLSIAEELAKMLDGRVGFKDTEGGGATFFAVLPVK